MAWVMIKIKMNQVCKIKLNERDLGEQWTARQLNRKKNNMKLVGLWKTTKKFDIKDAGQSLLLTTFKDEVNLELILEWRPLCDKKDLMHTIGTTFGGLHIYEYELLTASCYDCGHIGHGIKDCSKICEEQRVEEEEDQRFPMINQSTLINSEKDNVEFDFADKSNFGLGNDFLCSKEVSGSDSSNEGLRWNLIRPKGFIGVIWLQFSQIRVNRELKMQLRAEIVPKFTTM
ncbi:hypothetical protein Goarm_000824, partial [Gossypium armourianum]|nr:hypothetical protein [Gossypium armourianum]